MTIRLSFIFTILLILIVACSEEQPERKGLKKESFERLLENDGAFDLDAILKESINQNKPILLYFTGLNAGSFRIWEEQILKNPEVISRLSEDFLFEPVYVDDKRPLSKDVKTVSCEEWNTPHKTIGDANLCLQIQLCNSATQPYLLALDSRKKIIGEGTYENIRKHEDFLHFLKEIENSFD